MPRKKGSKNKKIDCPACKSSLTAFVITDCCKKHQKEADTKFIYKATLKSVGRIYQAEGATIEEAIRGIKISGGAKAVSVLSVEHGDKKTDKILSGITTHHLFGQGSPTTREIHLKKVKMLFDL
jgi:hypothetical protein